MVPEKVVTERVAGMSWCGVGEWGGGGGGVLKAFRF